MQRSSGCATLRNATKWMAIARRLDFHSLSLSLLVEEEESLNSKSISPIQNGSIVTSVRLTLHCSLVQYFFFFCFFLFVCRIFIFADVSLSPPPIFVASLIPFALDTIRKQRTEMIILNFCRWENRPGRTILFISLSLFPDFDQNLRDCVFFHMLLTVFCGRQMAKEGYLAGGPQSILIRASHTTCISSLMRIIQPGYWS